MTLSPTDPWLDHCTRADAELRWLLEITDGVSTWKALDGYCSQIDEPEAILDIDTISIGMDPLERTPSASSLHIDVDDKWIRPLIVNHILKGQKATLKLGAAELAEGDFLTVVPPGPVEILTPDSEGIDDSDIIEGKLTIEVVDVFALLERAKIVGAWVGDHHLEVIEDLCDRAEVAAAYLDTSSLDPADAANSAIGHFVISRGGAHDYVLVDNAVTEPTSALKLVAQVARLLNGFFVALENGKLTFKRFDGTAAIQDVWDDDVIVPGSFRQPELDDNVINQIAIKYSKRYGAHAEQTYVANETASQSSYAYPGTSARVFAHEFTTDWLECAAALREAITDADTSLKIVGTTEVFSGTRGLVPGPQPTEAIISATRPAYLAIQGLHGEAVEIVKAEACSASHPKQIQVEDPADGSSTTYNVPGILTFSTLTRAQLGTAAIAHPLSAAVWDITPLVHLADELLSRFKTGMPVIELRTKGIDKIIYQIGDIVGVKAKEFIAYGMDGLDGTEKFEIVGRELQPYGEPRSILWTLAYAGTASPTRTGDIIGTLASVRAELEQGLQDASLVDAHVAAGLGVTAVSGFNGKVAAGRGNAHPASSAWAADETRAFTASKDTYVAYDILTRGVTYYEASLGGAQPDKRASEVWLAKVVTDGSGITSVTDLRTTTAVNGTRLHDATVHALELDHSQFGAGAGIIPNGMFTQWTRG